MKSNGFTRWTLTFIILLAFGLSACEGTSSAGGTSVWIDVPTDGLTFPTIQAIKIEGHASSPSGVSRVEIWINGALLTTINNPPIEGDLARYYTEWTPIAEGLYTIQAIAFSADEIASEPDSARVTFGNAPTPLITVTPVISVTPVITDTPTILPGSSIQFWAEPPTIQAGSCTTIRWHVENAQRIIFGGIDQPADGSYEDCLCSAQRYTLTVVKSDGIEEQRTVDIAVNGQCETPTVPPPAADTTPPPAPSPAVPADGLQVSCRSTQTLAWLPVSDPSGVTYYVKLEIEIKPGQWQSAGGYGPIDGKQVDVNVQCGGIYRWMVRAQDGAGNWSEWSAISTFSVTLN